MAARWLKDYPSSLQKQTLHFVLMPGIIHF